MANPWWTGQIGLQGVVEASSSGGAPGLKKPDLGISAGSGREEEEDEEREPSEEPKEGAIEVGTLSYPSAFHENHSSQNPHFFKPIHTAFKKISLSPYVCMWISSIHSSAVLFKGFVFFHFQDIPTYFLAKYLKGQAPKFAILRRGDRSLRVKISGGR